MIKKRKGLRGVEGVKGICYQWKEKGQCSKGNQRSFWHESNDHAPKATPFAATPFEPASRRSIRGKSDPGALFDNRAGVICKRSPCEYWHPPELQFFKNETDCKADDKCSFPHHKVDEQTEQKAEEERPFTKKEEKATTNIQ